MIILVDQDGVLADYEKSFLENWKNKFPNECFISLEQRKNFHIRDDYPAELRQKVESIYFSTGFHRNLPPIPGSKEAIQKMLQLGHEVFICTAPLSQYKNCVLEKYLWVEEHFSKDFIKRIILVKDKTLVRGDILIDDRPDIKGVYSPRWEHVLYDAPQNKHVINKRRLTWSNWEDILFREIL